MWQLNKCHRVYGDGSTCEDTLVPGPRSKSSSKAKDDIKTHHYPFQEEGSVMRSVIESLSLSCLTLKQSPAFLHRIGICLCALVLLILSVPGIAAQPPRSLSTAQEESARVVASASDQVSDSAASPVTDPRAILRAAKLIYIRKKSVYFKAPELENELRKRPEFQSWGLAITRNERDADLIVEVGRKVFTTRFIYTIIDTRTDIVVLSGKLSSLGGTLATKIAKRLIEQMRSLRS
jgi:hypothetical protein